MKNLGSCGLKHARYDTSWRLLAARCLLVQNSLTSVSTTIGCFVRPTLVISCAVGRPFQVKPRSSCRIARGPSERGPWGTGPWGAVRTADEAARGTEPSIGTRCAEVQRQSDTPRRPS